MLAVWLAGFAKECIVGLADINQPILTRLANNQGIIHYLRPGLEAVLKSLDPIRTNPVYEQLDKCARSIKAVTGLKVYRWEAWSDTLEAIAMTADNRDPAIDNLARVRERLRRRGRKSYSRIASRTLLVKGLEYDHVIIGDASEMRDPRNLYVALSRARKSVTVIGATSLITLQNDSVRM